MKHLRGKISCISYRWHLYFWLVLGTSCATYYQVNFEFNRNFETGNLEEAEKLLAENEKAERGRNRFLYFLNRGLVASMLGKYEESNTWFEQAYIFGEDYLRNYALEAASFLTNPNIVPYRGEDHEHLMLLYFKAINFIKLGNYEAALVECRRLNTRLYQLQEQYRSDSRYKRDAFVHNLMGIIYEADQDYNNAFIAYRNAIKIYEEDYSSLFSVQIPQQLKKDVIRTAHLVGFQQEKRYYEDKFDLDYEDFSFSGQNGDLLFFWHNGLGPVKTEWSLNFVVQKSRGGVVRFVNEQLGYDFAFNYQDLDAATRDQIDQLSFLRVAFPKYVERPIMFDRADILMDGEVNSLEIAQNINNIAFNSLEQRMVGEFSKSLLRVASKKLMEHRVRKENEGAGAVMSVVNAATEKADTRNWQTLPHSIHYGRMSLPEGDHNLVLRLHSASEKKFNQEHPYSFQIKAGKTHFHTFHSLELSPRYMAREDRNR